MFPFLNLSEILDEALVFHGKGNRAVGAGSQPLTRHVRRLNVFMCVCACVRVICVAQVTPLNIHRYFVFVAPLILPVHTSFIKPRPQQNPINRALLKCRGNKNAFEITALTKLWYRLHLRPLMIIALGLHDCEVKNVPKCSGNPTSWWLSISSSCSLLLLFPFPSFSSSSSPPTSYNSWHHTQWWWTSQAQTTVYTV